MEPSIVCFLELITLMSFEVKTLSLSSLSPLRLAYNYNSKEALNARYGVVDSGLRYYEHDLLTDCADGAFSQQNAIVLTKQRDIQEIFDQPTTQVGLKNIACCFYLSVPNTEILNGDNIIKIRNKQFFVGGKGTDVIFNTFPIENGIVELKTDQHQIAVAENYPYELILLEEPLQENVRRQRFEIVVLDGQIALKNLTSAGYRYLSYGSDRILRCVGLQLNETIVNQYLFVPIFLSDDNVPYDFDPSSKEVRYYNQFGLTEQERTVDVKKQIQLDTNLLVSCSLEDITTAEEINVNIAITKTNFATSGTFNTSL